MKKQALQMIGVVAATFFMAAASANNGKGGGNGGGNGGNTSSNSNSNSSGTNTVSPVPCSRDSFRITAAAPAGSTPLASAVGSGFDSTSCYGVKSLDSNNPAAQQPGNNLGYAGDGLLNGSNLLPWDYFITASQLQDLNPNDVGANDPGWIQLGTMSGFTGSNELTYDSIKTSAQQSGWLSVGALLTFTATESGIDANGSRTGTWSLNPKSNIREILKENNLFKNNNFDHLAFVLKASDEWAVYDFDFNKLTGFDLTQPYSISGTWNLNDFKNGNGNDQGLSFMGVWARDPALPQQTTVPEPGVLALFGAGLLGMGAMRRRRQAKK